MARVRAGHLSAVGASIHFASRFSAACQERRRLDAQLVTERQAGPPWLDHLQFAQANACAPTETRATNACAGKEAWEGP